jgi:hypothetical protein
MKKDFLYIEDAMMTAVLKKGNIEVDNRFVVPYNRNLLVKYQAHINVEWCNMYRSVQYLFKYIHKCLDYVVAVLKEKGSRENQIDEMKRYLEMRYISTIEACILENILI